MTMLEPREADFTIRDFLFQSGERLPELRQHYLTLGAPRRDAQGAIVNAALLLHNTTGSAKGWLVPELADDPRFARNADRVVNRVELRASLEAALRPFDRHGLVSRLTAAGVPCGPINSVADGIAYAEELGLEPVVELGRDDAPVRSVRHPITFSATPPSYRLPPPGLGEQDAEIRAWLRERPS